MIAHKYSFVRIPKVTVANIVPAQGVKSFVTPLGFTITQDSRGNVTFKFPGPS
jgi:hypothetical protein